MIRPGRLWWLAKRDFKRGLSSTYHDYLTAPKIWRRPPPSGSDDPKALPAVHVIGGAEQFNLAGWMLATWFQQTGRDWRVVLHDDGTLTEKQFEQFARCYPSASIRRRGDSDISVAEGLKDHPACWKARQHYAPSLKFFDAYLAGNGEPFIVLDTDILFYQRPSFMLQWAEQPSGSFFMQDLSDAYITTAEECKAKFGLELWPQVNSGICLVEPGTIDLDFTEKFLSETDLLKRPGWTHEQTLFAVNASRHNQGGHLDQADHELSHADRRNPAACCRHYVGRVRNLFYSEGIASLKPTLLT